MKDLILYSYFRSSTSFRVRIALALKDLDYEYRPVHLLNNGGEQNQSPYRQINPIGGVPTLIHNGKTLSQSLVIMEYLDDAFPETYQLFPKSIFQRAKVKQFCENINADMHALGNLKVLQYLESKHGYTQSDKEAWVQHWFHQGFKALETMLAETATDYCFGEVITAADALLIPMMVTAERFKLDLTSYPLAMKIFKNCMQNSAFITAHPIRQPDTPNDLKPAQ
ncbi:MAG: maleylacetoacetate isomerase [Bdellovibrionales bacterium RIFCSPHIGHO2_01_FULL_40_29]|nr:MAG: maleylacetoacetate isomerase [Bdellovibrionales bacterium RIFCSPHIGHO2_01_FULL_40_29]OFZ35429.1 MAG: maleylacetoacetate isomerase [Bdellovibrionales bacterium RIFCSPHIGHO2_02_FULL_40_15]